MQNQENHNHFFELTLKYLSGNTNPAEVQELEKWVLAAPENKQQFMAFKKTWMLTGMEQNTEQANVNDLWEKTAQQIFEEIKVVKMEPRQNRRWWLGIAAAVVLLAVASFLFFQNNKNGGDFYAEATDEAKTFSLPDGSKITLNQSSNLSFSFSKKAAQRKVKLEGDAFFDVARDEKNPFIIQTGNIEIEVLGTSFYVDARESESEIQVIVASGKVAVRSGGEEQILIANEKAVFQKNTNQLSKSENDDANFLALKTKTLVFENTRLEEVAFALNRQFDVNISIENEALKDCKLDSTFKNKSLNAILKILETSLGIQVKQNGKEIELAGVCNGN